MDFNPVYMQQLLREELGGDPDDFFRSDMTKREAASLSLSTSILKKFTTKGFSRRLHDVAIQKFLECNEKCATFELDPSDSYIAAIIELTKSKLDMYFNSDELQAPYVTLGRAIDRGRVGPGASVGAKSTDMFSKLFNGNLSVTDKSLYEYYVTCIGTRWKEAELARLHHYDLIHAAGSSMSTVAKNAKTNRTICTEPSLNMFYQLGVGSLMEDLLLKFHNVDLSTQPDINAELARVGSLDGSFATIDLSSASDTISLKLLEAILPAQLYRLLCIIRSPVTVLEGKHIVLHMISTMGNGFTFPLQTMLFATLVRSTYEVMGLKPIAFGSNRNYAVFGDDIICLTEAYGVVCRVLHCCGFTVNDDKSFSSGPFRESCGKDFFRGHDVRGIYLKGVTHATDLYSLFNRLVRWSARHNIDISNTLAYIKGHVPKRCVPLHAGDTEGLVVPSSYADFTAVPGGQGLRAYQALTPIPRKRRLTDADLVRNPAGVLIAAIGGFLSSEPTKLPKKRRKTGKVPGVYFTTRSNVVKYQVVRKVTPNWDTPTHPGLATRDYLWVFSMLSFHGESAV